MKITFKAKNGSCPEWVHDGTRYYLFEDYYGDGSWTLMSQKIGFLKKERFYGEGPHRIHPETLLERFFSGKENIRHERMRGPVYWNGKEFATDGESIAIAYESKYERPSFDTYLECLRDAKEYLSEQYDSRQLSLFD